MHICFVWKENLFIWKKVKQGLDDKATMFEGSLPQNLVMDYCSSSFEQLEPDWNIFTESMDPSARLRSDIWNQNNEILIHLS